MSAQPAVLLFGDDTRSFLASVRSLGRQGIEVHAAPYSLRSPALRSRYIHKIHRVPYYLTDGADWLQAVTRIIADEGIGIIIACEERSMLPLMRHRAALGNCILALPEEPAFTAFFDKLETRRLAERAGVPAPRALAVSRQTSRASIEAEMAYPVVCKSRRSYDWPNLYARTKVLIARSPAELDHWLAHCPDQPGQAMVEGFCTGFGLGVSVLCDRGAVVQAFEHHRVSEMEGSSYYRVSRPVDPARLQAVQAMTADVHYTGLAMFEFKHDPANGLWALLEVNARPWGSLPLPVALGVDFPHALYQLQVHGQAPAARDYVPGICARNLVADFQQLRMRLSLVANPLRATVDGLGWLLQLPRVLVGKEHWDSMTRDDPRPGLAELSELAQVVLTRLGARLRQVGLLPQRRRSAPIDLSAAHRGRPARVLFLCLGNICRSPYAEHRARLLAQHSGAALEFWSAGTLPRDPRNSPETAVAAAARRGIDLSAHRSQHAGETIVAACDVIVYFDRAIQQAFLDRYPEYAAKLVHLGDLGSTASALEIDDPYGRSDESFDATYMAIDRLLQDWPVLNVPAIAPAAAR